MNNKIKSLIIFGCAVAVSGSVSAQKLVSTSSNTRAIDLSVQNEVDAAISRGLDWLVANQNPDGSWSNTNYPALTALPMMAFINSDHPNKAKILAAATDFLLSCVQADGGIYIDNTQRKGGGLSNYNTSISMMALYMLKDPALNQTILNARTFVAKGQLFGDTNFAGGFGYDKNRNRDYTDLLNTYYAVQAMSMTKGLEESRPNGQPQASVDWTGVRTYIEKMQNKPGTGEANEGGFFYKPGQSKAGTTNVNDKVVFRSYGSITYTGIMALLYSDVSRDDPRVISALDWASNNWSLDENPNMGNQGLFFFYNILSKTLNAANVNVITTADKQQVTWRQQLAVKLVSAQKVENGKGYWLNDTGRYWENDKVLDTAYSLLALESTLE
jgi:squalene-hopene/tetraprenyl-beta-curcumene cyclase